jgi:hypothetical protein
MNERFCLLEEGSLFINEDGELFSVIIAVEDRETITTLVRETEEGIEMVIGETSYTSHPHDQVVMVDREGRSLYLFYPRSSKLMKILNISTNRRMLHWQFDQLRQLSEGTYHLRKSTMIPGQRRREISRC